MKTKQSIRNSIVTQRRALDPILQCNANKSIIQQIITLPDWKDSKNIALYIAIGGEINIMDITQQQDKRWFLPRIITKPCNALEFIHYSPKDSTLVKNKFGILEPAASLLSQSIPAELLDIIFVPLVAYDANYNRLGMGCGFYDRTLAFTKTNKNAQQPRLIGLAHAFQKVEELPIDPWDIPLDTVLQAD